MSLSEISHMIHIIDTEHPWDVYCISSGHTEVISCLEWDQSGKPFLVLLFACSVGLLLCTFLSFACFLGFFSLCAGSRLLSADGDGQIKCWSMSDHLVNSWENILLSSVDGDPIVALTWLHNGVKLALHVEMVMLTEHAASHLSSLAEGVTSTVHFVSLLICFSLALQISGRSFLG